MIDLPTDFYNLELAEYPFTRKYFERADGLAMNYVDEGSGPPVVMVHGNPSWSFLFRKLISGLAPDYRCLAADHLGMGLSSRPSASHYGYKLADRAKDLGLIMEHWQPEQPVHLVVHDWGGPIGLAWAVNNPDQVASITIMNTGTRIPGGYRLPLKLAIFKRLGGLGFHLGTTFNLFAKGTVWFGSNSPLGEEAQKGFLAPYAHKNHRLAIGKFVEDIPMSPNHPSFAALTDIDSKMDLLADKPMTIIWGLRDFVFNRRVFMDWRERFPKAGYLALPEAGHYLLEDEPDRIIAHIRGFIGQRS